MEPVFRRVGLKVALLFLLTTQLNTGESDIFSFSRDCAAEVNTTDMFLNVLFHPPTVVFTSRLQYYDPREWRIYDV